MGCCGDDADWVGVALPHIGTRECECRKSAGALMDRIVLDGETMTPKF